MRVVLMGTGGSHYQTAIRPMDYLFVEELYTCVKKGLQFANLKFLSWTKHAYIVSHLYNHYLLSPQHQATTTGVLGTKTSLLEVLLEDQDLTQT